MEHTLRCNSVKCRTVLNDHAVVTTCSHIFCLDCSRLEELSGGPSSQRPICPACKIHLTNPDDVVVANLNPTEDYKTSVLSGLSPNVIMECAGRALSFWAYQATQQIVYQEHVANALTGKYGTLSTQLDKIIHNANGEISNLRARMTSMIADQDKLRQKHAELIQAYREKSRKALQVQELLDRSKRKEMLGQVQSAASDAVEQSIEASVMASRFVERGGQPNQHLLQPPRSPKPQQSIMQHPGIIASDLSNSMASPVRHSGKEQSNWARFSSQDSHGNPQNRPMQTPSTHRQRLSSVNVAPSSRIGMASLQSNNATPVQRTNSTGRSPLSNLNGNNRFAGYGMSAGLKVSNLTGTLSDALPRSGGNSRLAQRPSPTSGFPLSYNPAFGGGPPQNLFSNGDGFY